jgi:hypothetical protein
MQHQLVLRNPPPAPSIYWTSQTRVFLDRGVGARVLLERRVWIALCERTALSIPRPTSPCCIGECNVGSRVNRPKPRDYYVQCLWGAHAPA